MDGEEGELLIKGPPGLTAELLLIAISVSYGSHTRSLPPKGPKGRKSRGDGAEAVCSETRPRSSSGQA